MDLRMILNTTEEDEGRKGKTPEAVGVQPLEEESPLEQEKSLLQQEVPPLEQTSSEVSIIEEVFDVTLSSYIQIATGCKEGENIQMYKGLKNAVGSMKVWLHQLHLHDGQLDNFLRESDRLRVAIYMIVLRMVRLLLRAPAALQQHSVHTVEEFVTLEQKICQACPNVDPGYTGITEKDDTIGITSLLALQRDCELDPEQSSSSSSETDSDDESETKNNGYNIDAGIDGDEDKEEDENDDITLADFAQRFSTISNDFCFLANTVADSMEINLADRNIKAKVNEKSPLPRPNVKSKPFDYIRSNLKEQFPSAKNYLLDRLAQECWHLHCSIQKGIEERQDLKDRARCEDDSAYGSLEQSLRAPSLIGKLDATTPAAEVLEKKVDYAKSVATTEKLINLADRPKEPRPPVDLSLGQSFVCNVCSRTLTRIQNRRDWRKHVLSDIRPYICTNMNCNSISNRYPDRNSWMQHEESHHLLTVAYQCTVDGCNKVIDSKENLRGHISQAHPSVPTTPLPSLTNISRISTGLQPTIHTCPFCGVVLSRTTGSNARHVARHFEDVALPVLTSHLDDEQLSDENKSNSSQSDESVWEDENLLFAESQAGFNEISKAAGQIAEITTTSLASLQDAKDNPNRRIKCPWPECGVTFKTARGYDMQIHIKGHEEREKHGLPRGPKNSPNRRLKCPWPGCDVSMKATRSKSMVFHMQRHEQRGTLGGLPQKKNRGITSATLSSTDAATTAMPITPIWDPVPGTQFPPSGKQGRSESGSYYIKPFDYPPAEPFGPSGPVSESYEFLTTSQATGDGATDLASPQGPQNSRSKDPPEFKCFVCPQRFTRMHNLHAHLLIHADERRFVCTVCGKAFTREDVLKRHERVVHNVEQKFVCRGELKGGVSWGCGQTFVRSDALGRHFRSEAGRACIKPLVDEEASEVMAGAGNSGAVRTHLERGLPSVLFAQYPELAQWDGNEGTNYDAD